MDGGLASWLPSGNKNVIDLNIVQYYSCEFPKCNHYHLVVTNSLPWKITMFKNGKPSISMGHGFHGYVGYAACLDGRIWQNVVLIEEDVT